ncbi:MAG TPA: site-specific integrase [Flavisolibacter sp.]|jgi:site-specific recombinase XerD|nr:site-specific integrase [Flavisolibacter sp.]
MYTDPIIVHDDKPGYRSYVTFTVNGERHRFYNGGIINLPVFPNKAKVPADKFRLLKTLQFEFRKKLEKGWRPTHERAIDPYAGYTLVQCIKEILSNIEIEDISERYRSDLKRIGKELSEYAKQHKLNQVTCRNITATTLEGFLRNFRTSATYYMTTRSSLAGFFTRMMRNGMIETNPVWKTSRMKSVAVLNQAFTKDELRKLLDHLQRTHSRLHLCALLMYGCFLRPHREVRQLKRRHFSDDLSTIILGGNENKGKRIRIIRVPMYVREALELNSVHILEKDLYIVTGTGVTFNQDYFKTAWGRLKKDMEESGLIRKNHTLYSFRHTGTVELYRKTKDPYKVHQTMGHSSLTVTLTYLRSLGIATTVADDLPDL